MTSSVPLSSRVRLTLLRCGHNRPGWLSRRYRVPTWLLTPMHAIRLPKGIPT